MATATKRSRTRAKPSIIPSPAEIDAVADDVTDNVLVERKTEMRTIKRAALAGVNVHQLGPPGTGKSLGLRSFCERIVGASYDEKNAAKLNEDVERANDARARFFEKAVHAQMPADAIIGGYDMPRFAKTGEFARNSEHFAPNAHFNFWDEITRANGPTLDAVLPMLNSEERRAEGNGGMFKTPILFVVTASNYMPEPDDAHLGALVDRFTLLQYVDYVQADDSFKEMFRRHHARRIGEIDKTLKPATITLEQFKAAQDAVNRVEPTPEFLDAYALVRRGAKDAGLVVSDRRWMELGRVCRAAAWLAGRTELVPNDVAAVEDGLWRTRDEIALARKLLKGYQSPFEQDLRKLGDEAKDQFARVAAIRPEVEGKDPSERLETETMGTAQSVQHDTHLIQKRVAQAIARAEKANEDPAGLRDLADGLANVQTWLTEKVRLPPPRD